MLLVYNLRFVVLISSNYLCAFNRAESQTAIIQTILIDQPFHFKQFTVHQDRCAMKIGTDGVLLGAWVGVEGVKNILDIGTGTGVIALMTAQRSQAQITALEIDESAAQQAFENVQRSPWCSRIEVIHTSLQAYQTTRCFDLIVSNPPYFINALISPDKKRTQARHAEALPFSILAQKSSELLTEAGQLSVIIPTSLAENFIWSCWESGLYLSQRCLVYPRLNKPSKRTLLSFQRTKCATENSSLWLEHSDRSYTDEYAFLVKDFYIKL